MLNKPVKLTPDYDGLLNENFITIEDKMQYKAFCTYDSTDNVYILELLNIPAAYQDQLPAAFPDLFSVVVRFPNQYKSDAVFRIGASWYQPLYAAFESGDVQQINFNNINKTCFFNNSGAKELAAEQVTYENDKLPDIKNAKDALDHFAENSGGDAETALQIARRIYTGIDLTVKFALEIAATPYSGNPWAWIKARTQAGNFAGINIGDYIPFVAGGNTIKAEIAGINTYTQYGNTAVNNHIDFISRDCWPDTHVFNKVNYNNGSSVSPSPWLASDLYAYLNSLSMSVPNATTANPALVAVNYSTTGVYNKLPAELKAVIVQKRLLLPSRYTAGSLLTVDNSWAWADAGKLWIPSEIEVYGTEQWGSKNGYSGGGFQQYPIFATNMKRVKGAGDGGSRTIWWLLSASGGNSTYFATVHYNGNANNNSASDTSIRVPVCFRIA